MKKKAIRIVITFIVTLFVISLFIKKDVVLIVSNQSFDVDPIDLIITIGSDTVVNDTFYVENQHNWKVYKAKYNTGLHEIRVKSELGEAKIIDSFFLFYKKYIYVNYWYYPEDHYDPTPKHIQIRKRNIRQLLM
jgi:hypothetical protein